MISKSQIKFIKSLQLKKYRKQEQCFVVEGEKSVKEVMASDFSIVQLVVTESFHKRNRKDIDQTYAEVTLVSESQLAQLGSFQSNNTVIAVVRQKPNQIPVIKPHEFMLALDNIRDPGNLGAIIRTADWFGIRKIIASEETADFYNPKVIAATMGSFTRVQFGYADLSNELSKVKQPVYGAFMNGENIHQVSFASSGYLVIGNEAKGISTSVGQKVTQRIAIPGMKGAESLNAAVAAGIVLDNWYRSKK